MAEIDVIYVLSVGDLERQKHLRHLRLLYVVRGAKLA